MAGIDAVRATISCRHCLGARKSARCKLLANFGENAARLLCRRDWLFRIQRERGFLHRTALFRIEKRHAYFQAGAGIVSDSDPQREYEETVIKGASNDEPRNGDQIKAR